MPNLTGRRRELENSMRHFLVTYSFVVSAPLWPSYKADDTPCLKSRMRFVAAVSQRNVAALPAFRRENERRKAGIENFVLHTLAVWS